MYYDANIMADWECSPDLKGFSTHVLFWLAHLWPILNISTAKFRRHTSHKVNRMQMEKFFVLPQ